MFDVRAIAIASCAILASGPASAFVVWQGEAVVTSSTAACTAGSARTKIGNGTVLKSVVRPTSADPSNDSPDRIGFNHDSQSEMALLLKNGLAYTGTTGSATAMGVTHFGVAKSTTTSYGPMKISVAKPTTSNAFLKVSGTVKNFMFITGCTVAFRASYVLRP